MNCKSTLIRLSYAFLAALASPALAQEKDCPLQPWQTERTVKWESNGQAIQAGAGILDQIESRRKLPLNACTITPRTFNPHTIGNRNWYLYKCGDYQLVRLDIYETCEANVNREYAWPSFGPGDDRLAKSLSLAFCSIAPIAIDENWYFRDKKGSDFPLIEDNTLLSTFPRKDLFCDKNSKAVAKNKVYKIVGITSANPGKYVVLIRTIDIYQLKPIPEKVPSL